MRANSIMSAFSMAVAAAGLAAGCDNTPTRPGSLSTQDPNGRVLKVKSVEVVGPEVVPIGQTEQFRVVERLVDGSSRDLTDRAQWRSSSSLLSISMHGRVTGVERGDAFVAALLDEYGSVTKNVTVLPAGTFKLMGTVIEGGVPSGRASPMRNALVEVTSGVGAPLTVHTDYFGAYRFYGVSGEIGLRVTKAGYQPAERSTVVSEHGTTVDIELPLVVPPPDVSGAYTLTIKAAEGCGLGLGEGSVPEEARVRTYLADVRQDGPLVEVTLSGASLRRPVFSGRFEPGRVVFDLGEYDFNDSFVHAIMEQLPTARFLGVAGSVTAAVSANGLGGSLHADFDIYDGETWDRRLIARCTSKSHQFVLSR